MKKKMISIITVSSALLLLGCSNGRTSSTNTSTADVATVTSSATPQASNQSTTTSSVSTDNSSTTMNNNEENTDTNQISYKKYNNARFGFSIEYPSDFVVKGDPANGDGVILSSKDGSGEITASGGNNVLGDTATSYYNDLISEHSNASYKKVQNNLVIVSWLEGDKIVYQKSIVGAGTIYTFVIKYPNNQKEKYDTIINHLTETFKTDKLDTYN